MPRTRAACDDHAMEPSHLIVVGVDGSEHSLAAIRWAAAEARLRGARLRLVAAWKVSALMYAAEAFPPPYTVDIEDQVRTKAERMLDRACEATAADLEGLEVERALRNGPAPNVLCEASKIADMLVVGSRGLGGFSGLLLGSVSHQCAQQAPCPVMIVRSATG
jgi:nucleotide-binding universal stress UspA family protein